jgi:hypothetical protein
MHSHPTKVGEEQIAVIMALHQPGAQIQSDFGKVNLSPNTIGSIIRNHESGHGPLAVTEDQAREIDGYLRKGFVYKTIATKTGFSTKTIGRIARGTLHPKFLKARQAEEKAKVQKLRRKSLGI